MGQGVGKAVDRISPGTYEDPNENKIGNRDQVFEKQKAREVAIHDLHLCTIFDKLPTRLTCSLARASNITTSLFCNINQVCLIILRLYPYCKTI